MDKVNIFETFYIPQRQSEGWVPIKGGRNDDDRFRVTWQVGEDVIVGQYNDGESTVTEKIKKKKQPFLIDQCADPNQKTSIGYFGSDAFLR